MTQSFVAQASGTAPFSYLWKVPPGVTILGSFTHQQVTVQYDEAFTLQCIVTDANNCSTILTYPVAGQVLTLQGLGYAVSCEQQEPVEIFLAQMTDQRFDASTILVTGNILGTYVVDYQNGKITYTPPDPLPLFNTTDILYVTVEDGNGMLSNTAVIPIVLNPCMENPEAVSDTIEVPFNTPTTIEIADNDVGNIQRVAITSMPMYGTVVINGNLVETLSSRPSVVYTPQQDFDGLDSFRYIVYDNNFNPSNEAVVSIQVLPQVIALPTVNIENVTYMAGQLVLMASSENINSVDDIEVRVNNIVQPSNLITYNPGVISGAFPSGNTGLQILQVKVTNETGTASDIWNLVLPSNQSPVAVDDIFVGNYNAAVNRNVLLNDIDPEGGILSVVAVNGDPGPVTIPEGELEIIGNDTIRFTPFTGFTGVVNASYTISDDQGNESTAQLVITIEQPCPGTVDIQYALEAPSNWRVEAVVTGMIAPTYVWEYNGNVIPDATPVIIRDLVSESGLYTVTVSDQGCTYEDTQNVIPL